MGHRLQNERIAVVGGTGFIGSHLVEHLVRVGSRVVVLSRSKRGFDRLASVSGEFELARCDITDRASLLSVMSKLRPRIVFHLAGAADAAENFAQMADSIRQNTLGTVHLMEAAAIAGVELVVYGDSSKDYGNCTVPYRMAQPDQPICSYAIAKAAGWNLCRLASATTGVAVCAVRPTFVYGPRQNWNLISYVCQCVESGSPIRLQGGAQTRDPLYVEDAVRALMAVATCRQAWDHAIPIGGGREIAVTGLCQEVLRALGRECEVLPGANAPRMTEIWRSFCDNTEAFELLGWLPAVGLAEGLGLTLKGTTPVWPHADRVLSVGLQG
jgi:nucleoside-diphosphate-sugar epimerase